MKNKKEILILDKKNKQISWFLMNVIIDLNFLLYFGIQYQSILPLFLSFLVAQSIIIPLSWVNIALRIAAWCFSLILFVILNLF